MLPRKACTHSSGIPPVHPAEGMLLETIAIRLLDFSAASTLQAAVASLQNQIVTQGGRPLWMSLFKNPLVEGDWSLHLYWPLGEEPRRSHLGLHLAESFRNIGQVHHALWEFLPETDPTDYLKKS